jgi:hypothetical protein
MSTISAMINLDELLYAAYTLGLESEQGSVALSQPQLRSILLRNVPMFGKVDTSAKVAEEKTETTQIKEKKARKPSAALGKPRPVPDDETRCHARTFVEKDHLEGGALKVVREDESNHFGDRCKFKKTDGVEFCKHHVEKQPHGVWDNDYDGKFKQYIGKTAKVVEPVSEAEEEIEEPATAAATVEVKATPAKKIIVKAAAPAAPVKKQIKKSTKNSEDEDTFMEGDVLEKANIEYDWLEIDDISYMIDKNGDVYDPEDENKIGNYNRKTKTWVSGGPSDD